MTIRPSCRRLVGVVVFPSELAILVVVPCEYSWGSKLIPGNKTHQSRMMCDVDVNEWME